MHNECHDLVCNADRALPRGVRGRGCSCRGRDAAYVDNLSLTQQRDALQIENKRLTLALKADHRRVCKDCGEIFEWHAVDDIGRCGRCYWRFCKGLEPLNPGAGTHPDHRYVARSDHQIAEAQRDALKAALTTLSEKWRACGYEFSDRGQATTFIRCADQLDAALALEEGRQG